MTKLIVVNFKMNGNKQFYVDVSKKFNKIKLRDTKIILCPPFVYLPFLKIKNKNVFIASQNISNTINGSATGQISPSMIKEFDGKYALIGHYELRKFGEDLNAIKQKILIAVKNDIQPIICIGLNKNEALTKLKTEIEELVNNLPKFELIFAYEPIWAIDTNKLPDMEEIKVATDIIRSTCKSMNRKCKILYGGSVNYNNFKLVDLTNLDGLVLGRTSLNLEETISLINEVENE